MKLVPIYSLAVAYASANKWGTKKCKGIEKKGEVSGDCQAELIECSKATTIEDAEYQNCINIKIMDAFWNPPKEWECAAKYATTAEVDTCKADIKDKIQNCYKKTGYFTAAECIALSDLRDSLAIMDDLNVVSDDDKKAAWAPRKPCQAMQYAANSLTNTASSTTAQIATFNTCMVSYTASIAKEATCIGGDQTACDDWWALMVDLPGGQKGKNPYDNSTPEAPKELCPATLSADDLAACQAKESELTTLKADCKAEKKGDTSKAGSCAQIKAKRKEVQNTGDRPKTVKPMNYDICTTDHFNFAADTASCQTAVDNFNTARQNCINDATHADCATIDGLKSQLFPPPPAYDPCANAADATQCATDVAEVATLETDCKTYRDGNDDTKADSCNDLKRKKKELAGQGIRIKKQATDLCDGATDAAQCATDKATLESMKDACRKEAKGKADAVAGSCTALSDKQTELFPDKFPAKDKKDPCDGATDAAVCAIKVQQLNDLKDDCEAETNGDSSKDGSCDLVKDKRKEIMEDKVPEPKQTPQEMCTSALDTAACEVIAGELNTLRTNCMQAASKDHQSCKDLQKKRVEYNHISSGVADPCDSATDAAACKQARLDLKDLRLACKEAMKTHVAGQPNPTACDQMDAAKTTLSDAGAETTNNKAKMPKNLCSKFHEAGSADLTNCETAYTTAEGLFPQCEQAKVDAGAGADPTTLPACINLQAQLDLIPVKKTRDEKNSEKAARPTKTKEDPCDSLTDATAISECQTNYESAKALKAACKADTNNGVAREDSVNCQTYKALMDTLPKPDKAAKKKQNLQNTNGGIVLGRRRRAVVEGENFDFAGKNFSYRR